MTLKGSAGAQRKLNKREGELELLYSDAEGLRVSRCSALPACLGVHERAIGARLACADMLTFGSCRGDNGLLYCYIRESRKDMLSKA